MFEDTNYAGGNGTAFGAGDQGLANARVELYSAAGTFLQSTSTDASGAYSFTVPPFTSYTVRVVSASIGDADTPPAAGLNGAGLSPLAEQTYENNGVAGNGGAGALGGNSPATDDTATPAGAGVGDTSVGIAVGTTSLLNVSFGFAFNLVDNTANSGQGSLRQAMLNANAITGTSQVVFNIAGAGVRTIQPASPLPALTDPVTIDGATQPGYAGAPLIEIDGSLAGGSGITASGGNTTVAALAINRFSGTGIYFGGIGKNTVRGCYIGVNASGTAAQPNGGAGIWIDGVDANTIGGLSAASRNVISGNAGAGVLIQGAMANNNTVIGNYIGTDASGTATIGNGGGGVNISDASSTSVGGTLVAQRNIISGNTGAGVWISGAPATNNVVRGNYIGTNAAGDAALPNDNGVQISDSGFNQVGGNLAAARNLISGNRQSGILMTGPQTIAVLIQGNAIGTNAAGSGGVPNRFGITVSGGASVLLIGGSAANAGNTIAYNQNYGVGLADDVAISSVSILSNSIYANGGPGIDLGLDGPTLNDLGDGDSGPNGRLNTPIITGVTLSGGVLTVTGEARAGAQIELFVAAPDATGRGQGRTSLGLYTEGSAADTDAGAGVIDPSARRFSFQISAGAVAVGDQITATATDSSGNTSEFCTNTTVS